MTLCNTPAAPRFHSTQADCHAPDLFRFSPEFPPEFSAEFSTDSAHPAHSIHSGRAGSALLPLSMLAAAAIFGVAPVMGRAAPSGAADSEPVLPTVTVQETRSIDNAGYQTGKTRIGKVAQLPKDVPQSLTIVPEQLMRERNAHTFKEALRNVAALTFNAGEGGRIGDNITLRGYSAVGDLFLDGMRDAAQYNRETFNLEQIEVLRGSSSVLFGRGSTGGVINQVSKQPLERDQNSMALTAGSFNYRRALLDVNRVLQPGVALRVNAMDTETDSFRHNVQQRRNGVAPALAWRGPQDQVQLSYYWLDEHNIPDYGVPYFKGAPLPVPVTRFYGLANADYESNQTGIASLSYTHVFAPHSALRINLRQADYQRDLRAVAPRLAGNPSVYSDALVVNRQRQARGSGEHSSTLQIDFNDVWQGFGMRHEVLFGAEFLRERASRFSNSSALTNPATTTGSDEANPALPANFSASFTRTAFNHYQGHTSSLLAQDTLQLTGHWKLMLGTRFDRLQADYQRPLPAGALTRRDSEWSWRGGVLFQPTPYQTWYASYGSSFNPSAEAYQLDSRTANTPPEKSRNLELGLKWEALEGQLSLRSAIFRSEKTNERNTDLAQPDFAVLSGQRHTDGVELELVGHPDLNWEIFASAALLRGKIDRASGDQAANLGKEPINTPHHTASLWATRKLPARFKLGVGLESVGARYGNAGNTNRAPGYRRVDALLEWEHERHTVKLNLFNLFNRRYYESVYSGHVVPGTERAAQLSWLFKF
jgi:catecholate siderophore receptor